MDWVIISGDITNIIAHLALLALLVVLVVLVSIVERLSLVLLDNTGNLKKDHSLTDSLSDNSNQKGKSSQK